MLQMKKNSTTGMIPESDAANLAKAFLSATQRFFEDPENVRRFEEWRQKKAAANN